MSVTPDFVGQRYKDTNTGNIWIANSTTPGDWSLEVQDFKQLWSPKTAHYSELLGYMTLGTALPGVTDITMQQSALSGGLKMDQNCTDLRTISFPNLVTASSYFVVRASQLVSFSAPLLQSITGSAISSLINFQLPTSFNLSLPNLQTVAGNFNLSQCGTISVPSLVSVGRDIDWSYTSLTSIDVSSFLPTNTKSILLNDCALDASSVNQMLARCVANAAYVSGNVDLSGGTNASPSGQGIADKATLVGRGVTVTTN